MLQAVETMTLDVEAQVDTFTAHYIRAMLWSETDGDDPLDKHHDADDIAPETLAKIIADCQKFQAENSRYFHGHESDAAHDFWLTRNGHGAGFWDGDWEQAAGEALTKASKAFGECHVYVGDDGKIYL